MITTKTNTKKATKSQQKPTLAESAKRTQDSLRHMEQTLDLGDAPTPSEKNRANGLQRIPREAFSLAIDVAERHPTRFPDFDVNDANATLAFEDAMAPLAQQCLDMGARLQEQILMRKANTANQTLALYGSMKATARLGKGASMLPQIKALRALVKTSSKKKGKTPAGASNAAMASAPKGEATDATSAATPAGTAAEGSGESSSTATTQAPAAAQAPKS